MTGSSRARRIGALDDLREGAVDDLAHLRGLADVQSPEKITAVIVDSGAARCACRSARDRS